MRAITIGIIAIALSACSSIDDPESIINQLRLDNGEHGSVCARATVASPNPMSRTQVSFVYKEYPEGEAAPEC